MTTEDIGKIGLIIIVIISITETVYYARGYGMNYRTYQPEDDYRQWLIRNPNNNQRNWLLVAIVSKLILACILGFIVFVK